jgi:hypothetical protein
VFTIGGFQGIKEAGSCWHNKFDRPQIELRQKYECTKSAHVSQAVALDFGPNRRVTWPRTLKTSSRPSMGQFELVAASLPRHMAA